MRNILQEMGELPGHDRHFSVPARVMAQLCDLLDDPPRVLEIGTGYGSHLPFFAPKCERVVCIDPMYDWVPDIPPSMKFDPTLVDDAKLKEWNEHVEPFKDRVELVIGVSHEVDYSTFGGPFDIVIIDGCHHPWQAVRDDYLRLRHVMTTPHYAVFDDTQFEDPKVAFRELKQQLENEGIKFDEKHVETKWRRLIIYADILYVEGMMTADAVDNTDAVNEQGDC